MDEFHTKVCPNSPALYGVVIHMAKAVWPLSFIT